MIDDGAHAYQEVNFDGLVGPTHNYAGLSWGNVASLRNRAQAANPREAAQQGLAKMKALADLGLPQAVLPPQARPRLDFLRAVGFTGSPEEMLRAAADEDPVLLAVAWSASAMWTANAATVAPSPDTADRRLHLTPANLVAKLHRALEPVTTTTVLRTLFSDDAYFVVHEPLPAAPALGDEGAANHTRLAPRHADRGLHLFVYGQEALRGGAPGPRDFPARQTLEASRAVARRHGLDAAQCVFLPQNPAAIDAGVFHNDVIAVGHRDVFFYHELAFADEAGAREALAVRWQALHGEAPLHFLRVPADQVTVGDAVRSYLFNSQLIDGPQGLTLVAPLEASETSAVAAWLEACVADPAAPLQAVVYKDLRQSMRNGGGPACLRLRVVLNGAERSALARVGRIFLDEALYADLSAWIDRHYRESLSLTDLADPALVTENAAAFADLARILDYPLPAAPGA